MTTRAPFPHTWVRRSAAITLMVVVALVSGAFAFTPAQAAGVSITGQVTSEDGIPLVGARVVAYSDFDGDDLWHPYYETVTDTSGNYDLSVLARNYYAVGFADADGAYVPEYWDDEVGFDESDLIEVWSATAEHIDAQLERKPAPKPDPLRPLTNYRRATVEGFTAVGQTLRVVDGGWGPSNDVVDGRMLPVVVSLNRQWLRAGLPVFGATGSTYKVTAADVGATISVRETATSPGRAPTEALSEPSGAVKWTARIAATAKPGKKKATLRIKVASTGGTPTGTITIYLRYKKIKTVKLKNGKATVTIKKLKGKRRYTVNYNGSRTMYPARADLWAKPKK